MGFLDDAKKQASKLVKGREEQVKGGIDKAADLLEKKVGKRKAGTVDKVADKVKDVVDDLGGPDADTAPAADAERPASPTAGPPPAGPPPAPGSTGS